MNLKLHYAPDNASLIVRLLLDRLSIPYQTILVNREIDEHKGQAYQKLNPNGQIPALEHQNGSIFETGAILLWIADRYHGGLPAVDNASRGDALKWLFFLSNTLHSDVRQLFYPQRFIDNPAQIPSLSVSTQQRINSHLTLLNTQLRNGNWCAHKDCAALDYYLCALLRWLALYPRDNHSWFALSNYKALFKLAMKLESSEVVNRACTAEGLGQKPFTTPDYANPPEGSAGA